MKPQIIFDKSSIPFILEALGKTTDNEGFVIEIRSRKFVLDIDGKKFKSNKFIGIIGQQWITNFCQIIEIYDKRMVQQKKTLNQNGRISKNM